MSLLSILNDISASLLMVHSSGHEALSILANSIKNGVVPPNRQDLAVINITGQSYDSSSSNPFDSWEKGSIAIIPLAGIMLKTGGWWYWGVDEIAKVIRLAYASDRISAVMIKGNTPGGSTNSVYVIEDVLREKNKPTYMFVDGMLCSCGMYVGSFCDKIYAINDMCIVGSVGVMAQLVIPKENEYYRVEEIYPDESALKNHASREVMDGNNEPLKQDLAKLAIHFRTVVSANRSGITDSDVYLGKEYLAKEAVSVGLIDGVKNEEQVLKELQAQVSISTEVQNEITNSYK